MEDLWKKFKQETEKDMKKIRNFLDEISFDETSPKDKIVSPKRVSKHLVLDKETLTAIENSKKKSQAKKKHSPRKKIYGKLTSLVKEIMEKENLSRAQAYRVAKKRILNNF
jgi:hypothetical protein